MRMERLPHNAMTSAVVLSWDRSAVFRILRVHRLCAQGYMCNEELGCRSMIGGVGGGIDA